MTTNKVKPIMALINTLYMNSGDGESSYAKNSFLKDTGIHKATPFLKHSIKNILNHDGFNGCFGIADLGCSSGTSTIMVASSIIDLVHEVCQVNNRTIPQFQVCLNDLFGNDFNTLFKSLPEFYGKLKKDKGESFGRCFVSACPGSFYGRLFPDQSLHLVHSANSNHWLSQVPQGLENNGTNIYIVKGSPPNVYQAYREQFRTNFTKFLEMRSFEVVCGGCMVLTFLGRSTIDPIADDCCVLYELLGQSLLDLQKEGLIQESDISSFNFPLYFPCEDEVRDIIQDEGSFSLDNMDVFKVNWDPNDTDYTNMSDSDELSRIHGRNTSKQLRAVFEPLLISHFGDSIIDILFKKFGMHIAEQFSKRKTKHFFIIISLTKI